MENLASVKCIAVKKGEPALSDTEVEKLHDQVPEWQIKEVDGEKRLERTFKFKNFAQALEFTNKVGTIAEEEDHHPMIITEWGKVRLYWWTHVIGGLHKNDFIMAAKSDEIYSKPAG